MYGDDGRIAFIGALINDIDFRENRTQGQKDNQKVITIRI
jgi:hypothetical protein